MATGQAKAGNDDEAKPTKPYVTMSDDGFPILTPELKRDLLDLRSTIIRVCPHCAPPDYLCNDHDKSFGWSLRMALANIPSRYWPLEIEDTLITDQNALNFVQRGIENIDRVVGRGLGFTVVGNKGCGKTTLTIYFLKAALRAGHTGFFILMESLMTMIKDSFEDVVARKRLKTLTSAKVLILDDLGKEYIPKGRSEFVIARLDELFRFRDSMSVSTLMTSNLNRQGFGARYGGGILSLLKNTNKPLHLSGEDLRDKQDGWDDICPK